MSTDAVDTHHWDEHTELVVAGSGGAGLTGAYTSAASGLQTTVLEKTAYLGGTTAYSGSGLWLPGNDVLTRSGIADSVELGLEYFRAAVGDRTPKDLQQAYVSTGPELVRFLEEDPSLAFEHHPFPDYYPLPGRFDLGRAIFPRPVERSELGPLEGLVRPTIPVDTFGVEDAAAGETLSGGQALIARLLLAIHSTGNAVLRTSSPLLELVKDNGRVVGVVYSKNGVRTRLRATHGVLLAAGGFECNTEMRREQHGLDGSDWTAAPAGSNTGQAMLAAIDIAAATDLFEEAWWVPSLLFPNGRAAFIVGLSGGVFVDHHGQRFANEAKPYDQMGHELKKHYELNGGPQSVWWIFDDTHPTPPALISPTPERGEFSQSGLWKSATTIRELAEMTGLPQDALEETIKKFNVQCEQGVDTDFARGEDPYDLFFGAGTGPNSALVPVKRGPFHAVRIVLGDLGTKGGLQIDIDGRVLGLDGSAIEGLYAAGNNAASVTGHVYPGPGAPIGTGMVWGYRAALHAAKSAMTLI